MEERGTDPETGEEKVVAQKLYFKTVYVFDVSDTEGDPLPEFDVPELTDENGEELYNALKTFAETQCEVTITTEDGLANGRETTYKGYYSPLTNTIFVRPEMAWAQRCKAMAHEIAHRLVDDNPSARIASWTGLYADCRMPTGR